MKTVLTASAALFTTLALSLPAVASSDAMNDAMKGEKTFKKCKACHMLKTDDGEMIVKGGKTGPNLWGVIGRQAGSVEDYKFKPSIVAAGEAGLVWTEENLAEFTAGPAKFLKEYLDDSGAKSKMGFKLKKGGGDVAAYLATFSDPVEDPDDDEAASESTEESDS